MGAHMKLSPGKWYITRLIAAHRTFAYFVIVAAAMGISMVIPVWSIPIVVIGGLVVGSFILRD